MEIDTKDGFQLKVIAKGDTFEGYYGGQLISEIKDKDLRKGKVGARVYGSTAHIDDFDVNGKGIEPSPVNACQPPDNRTGLITPCRIRTGNYRI